MSDEGSAKYDGKRGDARIPFGDARGKQEQGADNQQSARALDPVANEIEWQKDQAFDDGKGRHPAGHVVEEWTNDKPDEVAEPGHMACPADLGIAREEKWVLAYVFQVRTN